MIGLLMNMLFSLILAGCVSARTIVLPPPQTVTTDCCDPGLSREERNACEWAAKIPNHTIVDRAGNHYVYIWSECSLEEPK